jgi:hypothetical protein
MRQTTGRQNARRRGYKPNARSCVGYHDASHFNREYKSLFGIPPMRDMQRLREAARESARAEKPERTALQV